MGSGACSFSCGFGGFVIGGDGRRVVEESPLPSDSLARLEAGLGLEERGRLVDGEVGGSGAAGASCAAGVGEL